MSFTERLWVWLHVAFVVFTIGPVTIATMSTPRYIRAGNIGVLRYLSRLTRIFGAASLGVLLFGIIAGQSLHKMAQAWITASLTLFVVALVLLVLIMRDQTRAIGALEAAQAAHSGPAGRARGRCRHRGRRGTRPGRAGRRSHHHGHRHPGAGRPRSQHGARPDRLHGRRGQPDLAGHPGADDLEQLTKRLPQVLEQVLGGLDADRQPDQVPRHLQWRARHRRVRHPGRMLDQ